MAADHDHPYKLLFSHPAMVGDLLRGFVPGLESVQYSDLERCNGSYVSEDWREREDDIVWRLRTPQGEVYVYFLIEFQSRIDRDMTLRLWVYTGLLWQDLRRTGAVAADAPLPPIIPMVLYNGDLPWTAPTQMRDMLGTYPPGLVSFRPEFCCLLLDEVHMEMNQHEPVRNLAAAIFCIEQDRTTEALLATGQAARAYLEAAGHHDLIPIHADWWRRTVAPTNDLLKLPNPFIKDASMIITTIRREYERLTAEGEARGLINAILDLVADGDLLAERACTRLQHLHSQRQISDEQLRQALATLNPSA